MRPPLYQLSPADEREYGCSYERQHDTCNLCSIHFFFSDEYAEERCKADEAFRDSDRHRDGERGHRFCIRDPCDIVERALAENEFPIFGDSSEHIAKLPEGDKPDA